METLAAVYLTLMCIVGVLGYVLTFLGVAVCVGFLTAYLYKVGMKCKNRDIG